MPRAHLTGSRDGRKGGRRRHRPTLWTPTVDLNEKIWFDWNYTSLANGPVSAWADSVGGVTFTQSDATKRPTKDSTGVVFSGGTKNLSIPNQTAEGIRTTRAWVLMFKANVAGAAASSGFLFGFNGTTGSATARNPGLTYNRSTALYRAYRGVVGTDITLDVGSSTDWHVAVWRVVNGVCKFSMDGGTEVASVVDAIPARHTGTLTGTFGDTATTTIPWTCKRFYTLQGELTNAELACIHGSAMWEMGVQAHLPGGHTYVSAAPTTNKFVNSWTGNTQAYWDATIHPLWASPTLYQHVGESVAAYTGGLSEVFNDPFTSDTLVNEEAAPADGTWFCPVQTNLGHGVTVQKKTGTPSVYSQSGSELQMKLTYSGGKWYGSNISSVNRDGRGNTWNPGLRPTYFEAKFKNQDSNPIKAWPAFWLKSLNEFARTTYLTQGLRTEPYIEIDIVELYTGDETKPHCSYHDHPAFRAYGGRFGGDVESDTTQLNATGTWPNKPVDLFLDTYHTYGLYIDRTVMIYVLDGLELIRMPTTASQWQPFYILFDVSLWDEDDINTGTHITTLDYIKVLQGAPY